MKVRIEGFGWLTALFLSPAGVEDVRCAGARRPPDR
jgi:hypothetical protein